MFSLPFALGLIIEPSLGLLILGVCGVLAGLFCGWLVIHIASLVALAEDVKYPIGKRDVSEEVKK